GGGGGAAAAEVLTPLGKREWTELARELGFRYCFFYYPFPGWRSPSVLLSEAAFDDEELDVLSLLEPVLTARGSDRAYSHRLIRSMVANKLVRELSDHLFVVLSDNPEWLPDPRILAWTFNPGRVAAFRKMTVFCRDEHGALNVRREAYDRHGDRRDDVLVHQRLEDEPYRPGRLYTLQLAGIVCTPGWSVGDVVAWARPYYRLLKDHARITDDGEWLEGRHLDLVPFNLLTTDRRLTAIDAEWVAPDPLPLRYVLFRGIYHSLARTGRVALPAHGTPLNLYSLSLAIAGQLVPETEGLLELFLQLEPRYFAPVFGANVAAPGDLDLDLAYAEERKNTAPRDPGRLHPLYNLNLQVFAETPDKDFSEETSAFLPIGMTERRNRYSIRLPWFTDDITRLRIDPSDHSGLVHVHAIHLQSEGEELFYWTPYSHADVELNGVMILQAAPALCCPVMILLNYDPMLIFSLPSITRKNPMAPVVLEIEVSVVSAVTSADVLNSLRQTCAMLPSS
ncbi:MAG TPA: hypothetical protein VHE54_09845, partial [Puia sp.]|nr:hypothetical protein [Puia sp.]